MPPPILNNKALRAPSVFTPDALIREARRQKNLPADPVPEVCVLDPDGDIVRYLVAQQQAKLCASWPCYHSRMYEFDLAGRRAGIVGCAVGSSYAVLIAEQAFACGARLLVSMTSAGQIVPVGAPPYFVAIERALRDEGTSYHYAPPSDFAEADAQLLDTAMAALANGPQRVFRGASWTTDAPFRETEEAIAFARDRNVLAVEMEAAALYAFARVRKAKVLCFAHVTNTMATAGDDFEKGEAFGATDALAVLGAAASAIMA